MSIRRMSAAAVFFLAASLWAAEINRDLTVERMRADLAFFASDECEGRGPGTKGIDKAADYIAAVFKESGLKGGAADGSYFQPFQVKGPARAGKTDLSFRGPNNFALTLNKDGVAAMGLSATGKADAPLVFVGHSVVSPKVPYDDFDGVDVEGKIVVMLRRTPRYDKKFADDATVRNVAGLSTKVENAEKRKAAGVILVNDKTTAAESGDNLASFSTFAFGSPSKIPVVQIKRDIADILFKQAFGKTVEELENEIDSDLKPRNAELKGWSAKLDTTIERDRKIDVKNVIGVLEASGPLAEQTIIVGAHYDHLGYGGSGSLERGSAAAIHHGADDNSSGTTAILELARRFSKVKDRVGRRLVFMAFSAEEMGLLGSSHYCKNPVFPLENTVAMLNLDMVGRLSPEKETNLDKIEIGGTGTAKEFDALLDKLNSAYKFKIKKTATGLGPSDHQSFYQKKLPVLFLFTGLHTDYHRPSDTSDKINYVGMQKIVGMAEEITRELLTMDRPQYVQVAGMFMPGRTGSEEAQVRPAVRIGIMPDYSDELEGVIASSVIGGGPADKAGLKDGDRITAIAGQPIKNITGYMAELKKCEAGKPVEFSIIRKNEKLTISITPTASTRQ